MEDLNLKYFFYKHTEMSLRVCLFGGEIWWMENFGKKMGRKTFWSVFGWMEREENK